MLLREERGHWDLQRKADRTAGSSDDLGKWSALTCLRHNMMSCVEEEEGSGLLGWILVREESRTEAHRLAVSSLHGDHVGLLRIEMIDCLTWLTSRVTLTRGSFMPG